MKIDPELLHQELKFRTSRASGSGGQHVNKVETRVELLFQVEDSHLLSNPQKQLILQRLHARINKEGTLIITSQTHRSQHRNKEEAMAKFDELIQRALKPRPKRKKVKRLKANPKKRLQAKKRRSEKKAMRKKVNPWD